MADQRILFEKSGTAKYISHLDLMHTMERVFLRAGIFIRHTEGFHPHPYVSIPLPLPLGFSSDCELMEFGIVSGATPESLPAQMNAALPAGIRVRDCYEGGLPYRKLARVRYELLIEYAEPCAEAAAEALRAELARESWVVTKRSKKAKSGFTELDLIPLVFAVEAMEPAGNELRVRAVLSAQNPGLNPDILLNAFKDAHPEFPVEYTHCHRAEVLTEDGKVFR